MKKWLILVSLVALFSGCNSNIQNSIEDTNAKEKLFLKADKNMSDIKYEIVDEKSIPFDQEEYLDGKSGTKVYYSDDSALVEDFNNEYAKLTGKGAPKFDGTMLILKMGTKASGGYSIKINKVQNSERYIVVEASFVNPPKGSLVTMSLTNPYKIIYIPHSHKEVKVVLK